MFTNEIHSHDTLGSEPEIDYSTTPEQQLRVAVLVHSLCVDAESADLTLAALGIESPMNGDEVYWRAAQMREVREILADRRITHEAIDAPAPVPASAHVALAVA